VVMISRGYSLKARSYLNLVFFFFNYKFPELVVIKLGSFGSYLYLFKIGVLRCLMKMF
jgi:hypothetical protein